jgi:hypothetical protein
LLPGVLALPFWWPGLGVPVFTDPFKKSAFYFDYGIKGGICTGHDDTFF